MSGPGALSLFVSAPCALCVRVGARRSLCRAPALSRSCRDPALSVSGPGALARVGTRRSLRQGPALSIPGCGALPASVSGPGALCVGAPALSRSLCRGQALPVSVSGRGPGALAALSVSGPGALRVGARCRGFLCRGLGSLCVWPGILCVWTRRSLCRGPTQSPLGADTSETGPDTEMPGPDTEGAGRVPGSGTQHRAPTQRAPGPDTERVATQRAPDESERVPGPDTASAGPRHKRALGEPGAFGPVLFVSGPGPGALSLSVRICVGPLRAPRSLCFSVSGPALRAPAQIRAPAIRPATHGLCASSSDPCATSRQLRSVRNPSSPNHPSSLRPVSRANHSVRGPPSSDPGAIHYLQRSAPRTPIPDTAPVAVRKPPAQIRVPLIRSCGPEAVGPSSRPRAPSSDQRATQLARRVPFFQEITPNLPVWGKSSNSLECRWVFFSCLCCHQAAGCISKSCG